jgi:3-methyladenine DNA glycosylase AlkD
MSEPTLPGLSLSPALDPGEVVAAITRAFESLSDDEAYREGVTRVVPGAGVIYGVRVPQLRDMARHILAVYKDRPDGILEVVDQCWAVGTREHCVLAIQILTGMKTLSPDQRWKLGQRYLAEVGDWETCDQLCMGLLGQALAEDPQYMDTLEVWVEDPNVWVRRAALASTVILRRAKFDEDTLRSLNERALEICFRLLDDEEHYVRKAVDWAVREVIRRDYTLGEAWLLARARESLTSVARSTLKKSAKKLTSKAQELFLDQIDS